MSYQFVMSLFVHFTLFFIWTTFYYRKKYQNESNEQINDCFKITTNYRVLEIETDGVIKFYPQVFEGNIWNKKGNSWNTILPSLERFDTLKTILGNSSRTKNEAERIIEAYHKWKNPNTVKETIHAIKIGE